MATLPDFPKQGHTECAGQPLRAAGPPVPTHRLRALQHERSAERHPLSGLELALQSSPPNSHWGAVPVPRFMVIIPGGLSQGLRGPAGGAGVAGPRPRAQPVPMQQLPAELWAQGCLLYTSPEKPQIRIFIANVLIFRYEIHFKNKPL